MLTALWYHWGRLVFWSVGIRWDGTQWLQHETDVLPDTVVALWLLLCTICVPGALAAAVLAWVAP